MRKFLFYVLALSSFLPIAACTSEYNLATRQQETLIYGTQKEVQIGDAVAQQIEEHYQDKIISDIDVNQRLQNILARIVAVCDRKELRYSIKAI
ncbi:MAG: hypothetical protein NUV91_06765, partial [Candidatus Omnitrophica bacterium]|nr:hypothetical protein [Candidatus Omnitrophota bacterium]